MTRRGYYCAAWRHGDEAEYSNSALVGTPTISGGVLTCDFGVDQLTCSTTGGEPDSTSMAFYLAGLKTVKVTDDASWADGTTRLMFSHSGVFYYAKKSGSNWVLYVVDNAATLMQESATARSFATTYEISTSRQIASPYRTRLWVDDTLDIDANAIASGVTGDLRLGTGSGTANGSIDFGPVLICYTDTDEHIDASTIDVQRLVPSGDGNYTEFTAFDEAGGPATAPYYDSIDEDAPSDGNTTFIQSPATTSTTFRATFTTTNITLGNVLLLRSAMYARGTVAAKFIDFFSMTRVSSTDEEIQLSDIAVTAYAWYSAIHYLQPSGSAWDQTALDGTEIGVRASIPADAVACILSTVYCEAGGCDFTANPATATRRRVGVAMTPGPMVF